MQKSPVPGRTAGILVALGTVVIWAGWIPVTRLGVLTTLTPWDVAALRLGTAALLMLPVFVRRFRDVPWRRIGLLATMAAGGGAPYLLAFGYGLRIANSGQGAVLGPGANAAVVALLSHLLLREHVSRLRAFGLAITLAGVATVVLHDAALGGVRLAGFALVLLACGLWASYTIASRVLRLDPLTSTAVVAVGNAVLFLPVYFASHGLAVLAAVPARDLAIQAVYQGVFAAVIAMIGYAYAVERLGATTAASFTPLAPVLAAALGWLLLGDRVDLATGAGLALVALGVAVASRAIAR